ncbi:T9SS type A sorting domain-containing protein, partial [Chitinophaga eiseniae]
HFYWTLASTGEHWDPNNILNDWTGSTFVPGATGGVVVAGGEINVKDIPLQLAPGTSVLVGTAWKPHIPQDYVNSPNQVDVCLLARITEQVATHPPFGGVNWFDVFMHVPETGGNEKYNVTNNNNIVTRNLIVTNTDLNNKGTEKHQVWVANAETEQHYFNLQLINNRAIHKQLAGDFSAVGYITLYLGDLFDRWVAAGSHGIYATSDEHNKSVTFDGSSTLELDGISLDAGERFPVGVEIHLRSGAKSYGNDFTVHFRQFTSDATNTYSDLYGDVSFLIKTPVADLLHFARKAPATTEVLKQGNFFAYPNPVDNTLYFGYNGDGDIQSDIIVTDVAGKTAMVKKNNAFVKGQTYSINTSVLQPGIYLVHFTNSRGSEETIKITKLK